MERIKLNLIPSGVAPIVHLSQYDDGRQFGIDLFEGESVYVLDGTETLTVNSRKPDGHVVVITVTNTGTSSLDVDTVEQLTAVHGVSYAKLQIVKGSVTIATLPFLIDVSRDPLENGDPSESFIQNLRTQIAEGVAEEVATQYDSANVIFDAEPTENHGIGYTVTSEGIKTAIDNAFDYDNTASGSIVHIEDGADNIPVKSLVSQIVAVESGNGQPKSPDNPYTISGFNSGVVSVCGKNLFIFSPTTVTSSRTIASNIFLKAGNYVCSFLVNNTTAISGYFQVRIGTTSIGGVNFAANYRGIVSKAFTLSEDSTINVFVGGASAGYNFEFSNGQIELGDTASTFEAYNGNTYTFTFGQTVYGGHFDNKGNLANNRGELVLSSLNWYYSTNGYFEAPINIDCPTVTQWTTQNGNCGIYTIVSMRYVTNAADRVNNSIAWYSNVIRVADNSTTDVSTFVANLQNQSVYYELANPIVLPISSQDIPTILGENNIFSNTDDIEVTYYTNKANDILEFVDSEIGKKNGTNIPIEANSQDSIKDYIDDEVSTINTSLSNKASKTEDTTITLASGYSLISSSCGKTDRLVHLNFNVEKSGGFATGWQVIGTTEFKPNTLAYCPLWNVTNGVGNGEVRIDTDGTINFYIVTAGELRLNANIGYITD